MRSPTAPRMDSMPEGQHPLATLLARLPGMAYRCGFDSVAMEFATGCEELTGYAPSDLSGNVERGWRFFTHPADRDRLLDEIRRGVEKRQAFHVTYRIRHADGSERWVWERGHGVFDADGTVVAVEGFIEDVTAQLMFEEQIQTRDAVLDELQRIANVGSWEWNVRTGVVRWSPELWRITGREARAEPLTPEMFLEMVHPDDRSTVAHYMRHVAESGAPFACDFRVMLPDGAVRHLHLRGSVFKGAIDDSIIIIGTAQDVTEQRRREQRDEFLSTAGALLASSLERDQLVDELSRIALPLLGDATVIDLLNHGVHTRRIGAMMSNLEASEIVREFMRVSRPLEPGWLLREALDTKRPVFVPVIDAAMLARARQMSPEIEEILKASGVRSFMIVPMVARDRPLGALSFYSFSRRLDERDLEIATELAARAAVAIHNSELYESLRAELKERQNLEAQVVQAQKMEAVALLAGGIAHDFNNLITVISGSAEMALDDAPHGTAVWVNLVEIKHAVDRAGSLTRQLLTFSRRQAVHPQPVAVNEIVQQAERMLRRIIGEQIELSVSLGDDTPVVHMDPGQFEQILVNLVINARDAIHGAGRITVSTEVHDGASDGRVSLRVRDTGSGMDEHTKTRIFEPFFTTKAPGIGTGLGLATVFTIVSAADGSIEVNTRLGAGTEFVINLPLYGTPSRSDANSAAGGTRVTDATNVRGAPELANKADVGERARTADAPSRTGGETVLLVEDEPYVRRLARRSLEDRGYRVLEAASAEEALEIVYVTEHAIHLLVTDYDLPDMRGSALTDAVRDRRPSIRVVYISGYGEALRFADSAVADATIIEKPFTAAAITAGVRATLDALVS